MTPRCAQCGKPAAFALCKPSEAPCHDVEFACARCNRSRRGYPIALSNVASQLAHLGDDPRTRRAGLLLAQSLLDAAHTARNRQAAGGPRRGLAA